jgi:TnpA family transposase
MTHDRTGRATPGAISLGIDTHCESEVGFGVIRLLGFDLLPRIKQIN